MKKFGIEPVDLMVAVGLFATVMAGIFLFIATGGAAPAGWGLAGIAAVPTALGPASEIEWVQPVLGQAIVEGMLVERKTSAETMTAAAMLNRAILSGHVGENSTGSFQRVKAQLASIEAAHAARVQFVTGRLIVESTLRGLRAGAFATDPHAASFNRRILGLARHNQEKMEKAFLDSREANKGQAIVAATLDQVRMKDRTQEQIGTAIVEVLKVQNDSQEALARSQEQLASAAFVTMHSQLIADRFATLAAAEATGTQPMPLAESRSWPEIPFGLLLAASTALIGLFGLALVIPTRKELAEERGVEEEQARTYRRAG
jgi:hypothetical protein